MSTLALELSDVGIIAVHEARPGVEVIPPSPGFALLDGEGWLTGEAAFGRSRLKPRWVVTRHWETLDTSPLPRPFPRNLTCADLVHAHLEGIWKTIPSGVDEVILAVPGWYTDEQLGLILGIARSAEMPVDGMVDSALAAASTVEAGGKLIYLDLHLHRTIATALKRGADLHRGDIEVHPRLGWIVLWDDWVRLIAQLFVKKTRFDPLHLAETEQNLYQNLVVWLDRLREGEATVLVMEAGGKQYSIELRRDEVVRVAEAHYEQINRLAQSLRRPDEKVTLLVSHRLGRLPGLVEILSAEEGSDVISLPSVAAAAGALRAKPKAQGPKRGEEVTFVTRLSLGGGANGTPSNRVSGPTPTHVLRNGIAVPITSEPFFIGPSSADARSSSSGRIERVEDRVVVYDESEAGLFLNGRKIEGSSILYAGDRVRLGISGKEVELIRVMD